MGIQVALENVSAGEIKVNRSKNTFVFNYPCSTVETCTNYVVKLPPNLYIFEAWGAEGGFNGGKGGYSRGIIRIRRTTEARIFIGSKGDEIIGKPGLTKSAFNGGGKGGSYGSTRSGGSGGGSTDLRIGSTLFDRIIVAGAGGGGNKRLDTGENFFGGDGGGIEGKIGTKNEGLDAPGGNQTSPGIGQEEYGGKSSCKTHSGLFGLGGY